MFEKNNVNFSHFFIVLFPFLEHFGTICKPTLKKCYISTYYIPTKTKSIFNNYYITFFSLPKTKAQKHSASEPHLFSPIKIPKAENFIFFKFLIIIFQINKNGNGTLIFGYSKTKNNFFSWCRNNISIKMTVFSTT